MYLAQLETRFHVLVVVTRFSPLSRALHNNATVAGIFCRIVLIRVTSFVVPIVGPLFESFLFYIKA